MITVPLLQDLARRLPSLDRVYPFPGFPGIAEQLFQAPATVRFLQEMQVEQFDLAIQMQGTGVYSNPFVLLLGARASAGFVRPGDPAGLLDAALPYPHDVHEIHCVLSLSEFLGAPTVSEDLEFPLLETERKQIAERLVNWPWPWIGLHPSARDEARRWPLENYLVVAKQLLTRTGGTVLLLGDEEAVPAGRWLAQRLPARCLDLTGQLSLTMLGALIERLTLLITNDSGPAHIAYALSTPAVVLFGKSTSPRTNGPLHAGPFRLLCAETPEQSPSSAPSSSIHSISVEQTLRAAEELLRA